MQKSLLRILLLLLLFATISPAPSFAQKKKKVKSKVYSIKKSSSESSDYYKGHKIYTGPRGGRYYINSNGNKTYI